MDRATLLTLLLPPLALSACAPALPPAPDHRPTARYPGPCLEDAYVEGRLVERVETVWEGRLPVARVVRVPALPTGERRTTLSYACHASPALARGLP